VPHSTLLYAECVDTIKPSVSIPDLGTETLYFFRFFKEQYSRYTPQGVRGEQYGEIATHLTPNASRITPHLNWWR